MLVLTRMTDERIVLTVAERLEPGAKIEIVLVSARERRARIGIEAPEQVEIVRAELVKSEAA